ncbi:hypothetical protein J5N97_022259 [Dioscorea zingiberensis]|uniref:Serine/threonine-protein kinase RIO2 n=1 Tax=Dioscorea zingiberensis TaxID=325984 RepID=A0A9D5CA59_9LILI|nr:hypothetical protein J5N97_022259 [Dioscorea zingiberensis]
MLALLLAVVRRLHTSGQPPRLTKFTLHPPKAVEVEFSDGRKFQLSAEFLRVHSPSVDSKVRSIGGEKVISGRRHVGIMSAEPVGNYGVKIIFDDLHKTGIYTWDYFHRLEERPFSSRAAAGTMKLDGDALRYLSRDDFRVLTAVEMGMRNHEIVPAELVDRIAGLKHGGTYKVLKNLLKHKLVHHDSSKYDGFRLTYLGYDFLAIKTLVNRGVFSAVGRQIGVGKESDIFEVAAEDGTVMAMKLHRLGRVSFRAVKAKRDYLLHRNSYNWLYLSRLAALKEYAFMKALGEHGFPVPSAVDCNRHCVIMSLVEGYPLVQVKQLQNPDEVFEKILGLVVRLAEHGLIHCDFNEFNIMIDDDEKVTMIDFPQMVSVSHRNAEMYFDRDVECIFKFFRKRFNLTFQEEVDDDGSESILDENGRPTFSSIAKSADCLDKQLAASGFTRRDQDDIEKYIEGGSEEIDSPDSNDEPLADEDQDPDENSIPLAVNMDALCLADQHNFSMSSDDKDTTGELQLSSIPSTSSDTEMSGTKEHNVNINCENGEGSEGVHTSTHTAGSNNCETSQEDKDDSNDQDEGDALLTKRLSRQRRRAVAAAHGGSKVFSSRNSYKDKGGKSNHNSKLHRQACQWASIPILSFTTSSLVVDSLRRWC